MRIFILLISLTTATQLNAQYFEGRVRIDSAGRSFIFQVTDKHQTVSNHTILYWFKSGRIHQTQGSYYGRLLHGRYLVTDSDRRLLEEGQFKNGIKTGTWRTWHENGILKSIWRRRFGLGGNSWQLREYNSNGDLIKKGFENRNGFTGYIVATRTDSAYLVRYKKSTAIHTSKDSLRL